MQRIKNSCTAMHLTNYEKFMSKRKSLTREGMDYTLHYFHSYFLLRAQTNRLNFSLMSTQIVH